MLRAMVWLLCLCNGYAVALPPMAAWLADPDGIDSHIQAPLSYQQLLDNRAKPGKTTSQGMMSLHQAKPARQLLHKGQPEKNARQLPAMQARWYLTSQGQALSLNASIQIPNQGRWDYVIGNGRHWPVPDTDDIYLVAPLHLIEKNQNCVHNGVLTLRLPESGGPGSYYYQISSETCAYYQADLWGSGKLNWQPMLQPDADDAQNAFQHWQQTAPLSPQQFARLFPDADIDTLMLKDKVTDISMLGWVHQGLHVQTHCPTRAGNYPFCRQLLLPSYSTAKSFIAGNGLMYLNALHPGLKDAPISQFIPQCSAQSWQEVTLQDLLNMRSGHFLATGYGEDEGAPHSARFFEAITHKDKITYACGQFPRQAQPGEQFVYHSSDTYLLGAALQTFVKQQYGQEHELIRDVLFAGLYQSLSLSEVARHHRHTQGQPAMPFFGYGSLLYVDDLLAIARFTQQQQYASRPLLDPVMLAQALPSQQGRGLATGFDKLAYSQGYWALDVSAELGCQTPTWLAFMSGYGGVTVVLLPDNRLFYYFSDGQVFKWLSAIEALHSLSSICQQDV